jgi:hypothetical protein
MDYYEEAYIDVIRARGHRNVRATHRTTLEITKETDLTPRGDCIVAVSANKALKDLNPSLRMGIRMGWPVAIVISCRDLYDYSIGLGDPRLELNDPVRIVARKSSYISPNTLMIRASKAAADLDRRLVNMLRSNCEVKVTIVTSPYRDELLHILRDLGFIARYS